MSARYAFIIAIAALSLNACVSLESKWRWNGISAEDETAIGVALRKITNSPIVDLQPRNPDVPNQIYFWTADHKIYSAEKTRGRWQISEAVLVY